MERQWRERTISTPDVDLHVREAGNPGDPTVVLVHGYPDSSAVWTPVATRLAADHHVVAYDVRGMGRSSAPRGPHPFRLARLADDLFAVIDAVAPGGTAHVVGHDWGSIQAWEAVTDPDRQDRILSFTTMSGPCLDHVGHLIRERMRRQGGRRAALGQAVRSLYIPMLHVPGLSTGVWRVGGARGWKAFLARTEGLEPDPSHDTLAADGRTGVHLYRANMAPTLRNPRHRTTDVPVLVITLSRDRYVRPVLLEDIERWAPHTTRRSIDAGHWAPRSEPDAVARAVSEHVAGAVRSAHDPDR